jgi:hypothetical protein
LITLEKEKFSEDKLTVQLNESSINTSIYPLCRYCGHTTSGNLALAIKLQNFAQEIGYISILEVSGKISPEEACKHIKSLWQEYKSSQQELVIGRKAKKLTP